MVRIVSFDSEALSGERLVSLAKPGDFEGILHINYHRYGPGETHETHRHRDREEIFVCVAGRGYLTGSVERSVGTGDIIVVSPGDLHGFVSDEAHPLEYICIGCRLPRGKE